MAAPRLAAQWLQGNGGFHRRCSTSSRNPVQSRDIPDTSAVPWASTRWTKDRNVTQMLEMPTDQAQTIVYQRRLRWFGLDVQVLFAG